MLTMDAKRNAESYSYPNGMLNCGWIAGVLRIPPGTPPGQCFIQQTRSENHMLPIEFDPKASPLPRDLKEWDLVMAYCHATGAREGDQRVVRMKSIRFEAANTMHMDKDFAVALLNKWAVHVHDAAKDSGTPTAIQALRDKHGEVDPTSRIDSFDWKAMKMNQNAANHVRLAGFVEATSLERNRVTAEGKPMNDRLIVLLRQAADPEKCIAVRWYHRNLEPLSKTLRRGMPILVAGEFRLDVKAIDAPDPGTGIAPTSKIAFIQAKEMPQPVMPDSNHIRVIPYWAQEMLGVRQAQAATVAADDVAAGTAIASSDAAKVFAATFGGKDQEGSNG